MIAIWNAYKYQLFAEKLDNPDNLTPEELDEFIGFVNSIADYMLHPAILAVLANKYVELYAQVWEILYKMGRYDE